MMHGKCMLAGISVAVILFVILYFSLAKKDSTGKRALSKGKLAGIAVGSLALGALACYMADKYEGGSGFRGAENDMY